MKLKNVLIVVKDIEKSKQFYHDLFGLDMILDNDGNLIEKRRGRPRKQIENTAEKGHKKIP